MLLTYGAGSPFRNGGSTVVAVGVVIAGVAFGGVVWFCILDVLGIVVVTDECCGVGVISVSAEFFCSEILSLDEVGGDGAGVVHPAASMTMQSALITFNNHFCITPALIG